MFATMEWFRFHQNIAVISMSSFFVFACSEYSYGELQQDPPPQEVIEEKDPPPEVLSPLLVVDPIRVYEEHVCATTDVTLTLLNAGEGPLVVQDAMIHGSGWFLYPIQFPISLNPFDMYEMQMMGEAGTAVLEIQSNDPIEPQKLIELTATEDSPPSIAITDPFPGAVIPIEGQTLTGHVEDDVDNPEDLTIVWTSDVDGVLGTSQPNPDGSFLLENFTGSPGLHELAVDTQDSCENPSVFPIVVCQQYGYEVDSLDISTWNFEGAAFWDTQNNWVELTSATTNQVGSAFSTAVPVSGGNVEIEFQFYIGDGSGADGISLTALDIDRMTTYLGGTGCGIGYGGDATCTSGPALPGWSIEVDTYYNGGQDPTSDDHMAFMFDGDVDGAVHWASLPEIEDTGWHNMRVVVTDPHVLVEIDGMVYMDQDVSGNFNFPAYIGFTAGTGGATNRHLIDSLVVTESICEED